MDVCSQRGGRLFQVSGPSDNVTSQLAEQRSAPIEWSWWGSRVDERRPPTKRVTMRGTPRHEFGPDFWNPLNEFPSMPLAFYS